MHRLLQKLLCFLSQHFGSLSKRWRDLWTTRRKVDFSDASFKGTKQEFISTLNNTLQKYHHQNLSLHEFHLSLSDDESFRLLEQWIPRLTHMGVKEFYLSIASKICIKDKYPPLPWVVFDAGSCLQELHVTRYKLDHHHHHDQKIIIALKNLKRLQLDDVRIEDDEILHDIISSCPSIETLRLQDCEGLTRVKLKNNLSNLKDLSFSFSGYGISRSKCCRISFQPQEFRNLNNLDLTHVRLSVPHQLSSCKFPCLEYLTLRNCYGFEYSQLFVDAPKIVRFTYAGEFTPSISFAPTSSEWNSDVCLVSWPRLSNDVPLWLLNLSQLLKSLSQSTISLNIYQCYPRNNYQHCDENGLVVQQPVEVESLRLSADLFFFPCLLNALFRICRPKNVVNCFNGEREIPELLCKILMQRGSRRSDWVRDLEDVRMEMYDKSGGKWDEVTVSEYSMPKGKTGEYLYTEVRFTLKWREA